jgi:hypothetical protein
MTALQFVLVLWWSVGRRLMTQSGSAWPSPPTLIGEPTIHLDFHTEVPATNLSDRWLREMA